jgi:hypothetical protein
MTSLPSHRIVLLNKVVFLNALISNDKTINFNETVLNAPQTTTELLLVYETFLIAL